MSAKAYDIGTDNQIFVDGRFLDSSDGVQIVTHEPGRDSAPCLVADRAWERQIGGYNTVLHAGGRYHLWYTVRGHAVDRNCIGYAVSDDGVDWSKPELGFAREVDDGRNNIVLGCGAGGVEGGMFDISCHVFEDPNHEDQFAMLARLRPKEGLTLLRSSDGVSWYQTGVKVLDDEREFDAKGIFTGEDFHLDSQNVVFWDDRLSAYVAYVRRNLSRPGQYRTIARGVSEDLFNFVHPREMDVVMAPDSCDPTVGGVSRIDFYTNATIKYPWASDAYFMFPSIYYKYDGWFGEDWGEEALNAGVLDTALCASRDGVGWTRFNREPFVRLGYRDRFDAASIYMAYGMVPSGRAPDRELCLYYSGSDHLHGWGRQDKHQEKNDRILTRAGVAPIADSSGIGRVTIRRDGFTSARGDYRGGVFTTPPVQFSGSRLSLNLDTSAVGEVSVEIQNQQGAAIEGFSHDECRRLHSMNAIEAMVRWKGDATLAALAGTPVRLSFRVRSADVYSFRFS